MRKFVHLLETAESLIQRLERLLPPDPEKTDWDAAVAFQWCRKNWGSYLQPIPHPNMLRLADLQCLDRQKAEIDRNTLQFIRGYPANNTLLWGSRGTGKSSMVKALLNQYASESLRQIEVHKKHLTDLPEIINRLDGRDEKFIIFCDDLSFEANDPGYKTLKAALDGSLYGLPDNILIYATSNRRHLIPEFNRENLATHHPGGEIHFDEGVEEKISLSDRFGLWLSFHPFTQDEFLRIVRYWLGQLETPAEPWEVIRSEGLRWALNRGTRSGRAAWQFAKDWSGRQRMADP